MKEISRERRAELRLSVERMSNICFVDELRALLDYADERDEAVALLQEARPHIAIHHQYTDIFERIDALLRRVGGEK